MNQEKSIESIDFFLNFSSESELNAKESSN